MLFSVDLLSSSLAKTVCDERREERFPSRHFGINKQQQQQLRGAQPLLPRKQTQRNDPMEPVFHLLNNSNATAPDYLWRKDVCCWASYESITIEPIEIGLFRRDGEVVSINLIFHCLSPSSLLLMTSLFSLVHFSFC